MKLVLTAVKHKHPVETHCNCFLRADMAIFTKAVESACLMLNVHKKNIQNGCFGKRVVRNFVSPGALCFSRALALTKWSMDSLTAALF